MSPGEIGEAVDTSAISRAILDELIASGHVDARMYFDTDPTHPSTAPTEPVWRYVLTAASSGALGS